MKIGGVKLGKQSKRGLIDKADRMFSLQVRALGICERCGSFQNLETAHIISRNNHFLRFDEKNALCLCKSCHKWGHENPNDFMKFAEEKKGYEVMSYLQKEKNRVHAPFSADFYKGQIERLKVLEVA